MLCCLRTQELGAGGELKTVIAVRPHTVFDFLLISTAPELPAAGTQTSSSLQTLQRLSFPVTGRRGRRRWRKKKPRASSLAGLLRSAAASRVTYLLCLVSQFSQNIPTFVFLAARQGKQEAPGSRSPTGGPVYLNTSSVPAPQTDSALVPSR